VSTALYYFSGTGNSLHAARELQRRLPGSDLIPIIPLLKNGRVRTSADTVGLVFPNFCLTIPIPVHDLLEKADYASAQYIFAVCTRGGTPSEAFNYINQVLSKQGRSLDAQFNLTMPWNHPLGEEDLPSRATRERVQHLESEMKKKLDALSRHVLAREPYLKPDTDADFDIPRWMDRLNAVIPRSWNYQLHRTMYQDVVRFYSDSACNECGVCEKVCLSHKIAMVEQKPVWKDEVRCYGCFACINFCPQRAVQIRSRFPVKSATERTGRYHHPSVTYRDIAEQRAG
jgi:ferredoxin